VSRPLELETVTRAMLAMKPSGAPRRAWSAEDVALLVKHYRRRGPAWCAKKLGRPVSAVHNAAQRYEVAGHEWSQQEVRTLRAEWGELGVKRLRMKLPGRTWAAIADKAQRLKLPSPNQGLISINEATRETGINDVRLLRILAERGVQVYRRRRANPRKTKGMVQQKVVDRDEVIAAVSAWLTERARRLTQLEAAARYDVGRDRIAAALKLLRAIREVSGYSRTACSLLPEDVEASLAQLRDPSRCWRVPARCGGDVCSGGRVVRATSHESQASTMSNEGVQ